MSKKDSLTKADKNFEIKTKISKEDIVFYDSYKEPFKTYGVFKENGKYCRIPEKIAESVSEGVHILYSHTAGGRVRFKTDSSYVAIFAELSGVYHRPHMTLACSSGFDLYVDNDYSGTFLPPWGDMENETYESIREFGERELREITINFPLYCGVKNLYIGLQKDAILEKGAPYENEKPVVYYGSSITQGGCASRPGMSYQSIISRRFNQDYINLGFSGSAKAEKEMIDYIKNLDMSIFVYDYDHNAPSVEHLLNTHEVMFREIRKAHPDIPVIMMSRPKYSLTEDEKRRLEIIETTYKNALASGDEKVYIISGEELCALCKNDGTVDGTHPNDFGFASMAKALGDVFAKL